MAAPRKAVPRKRVPRKVAAPKSMPDVVREGDLRASLVALRDHLAERLLTAERDAAPLARQLQQVLTQLAAIPAPETESKLDEISARRAARRAKAAGS